MTDVHIVVLAAGKGTRMKSRLPEGAAPRRRASDDRLRARAAAGALARARITVVVGHQAEALRAALSGRVRPDFRGPGATTRHRPRPADDRSRPGRRTPARSSCCPATCRCCRPDTLENAGRSITVDRRRRNRDHRVGRQPVRLRPHRPDRGEQIARIVEEKDATADERTIREINSGIYAFALDGLFDAVREHRRRKRPARVLPARPGGDLPAAGPRGRDGDRGRTPTRSAASTADRSWRR